jgi:hypothetical protein
MYLNNDSVTALLILQYFWKIRTEKNSMLSHSLHTHAVGIVNPWPLVISIMSCCKFRALRECPYSY